MEEAEAGTQQPAGPAAQSHPAGVPGAPSEIGEHRSQERILPEEYLQASQTLLLLSHTLANLYPASIASQLSCS